MNEHHKETPVAGIQKQFLIERQGRTFALYNGLIDYAHSEEIGLSAIKTDIIQFGTEENDQTWIFRAVVETKRGVFTGFGDASPANVTRAMLTCLPRMAETRAKARALRDALNAGVTAYEELGPDGPATDDDEQAPPVAQHPPTSGPGLPPVQRPPAPTTTETASDAQVRAIYAIASNKEMDREELRADVRRRYGRDIEQLSKAQASALISQLKGEAR